MLYVGSFYYVYRWFMSVERLVEHIIKVNSLLTIEFAHIFMTPN